MPVALHPWSGQKLETAFIYNDKFVETPADILEKTLPRFSSLNPVTLLQSSYDPASFHTRSILPTGNGLVHSIIQAYSRHYHLRIRPDDIWFSIISQFSFYVNAHAEELRDRFVSHQGKQELEIVYNSGNRFTFDHSKFAKDMSRRLDKHVIDVGLRYWIQPAFTTTTETDEVIASIMMMGVLQKYVDYTLLLRCGLLSITLLGEKSDYEVILRRLDKLDQYGREPAQFATHLRPVIKKFIRSFEQPDDLELRDFWQRICNVRRSGSGTPTLSGWVTAFCFWEAEGKVIYQEPDSAEWENDDGSFGFQEERKNSMDPIKDMRLTLDGVKYAIIGTDKVPPAWVKTPVKIDDNGEIVHAEMLAGSAGIECVMAADLQIQTKREENPDCMQASTGWWVYEKPG